ncbi:Putative cell-wall binding lipoprotein [Bacillus sp. OV322]|uniref:YkyA family protein n=1 Tax=Bacillus sp. OV322 TaxID=1882764 RepID=UPI0008DF8949|nr:YkyA family protein [Bacillus sp. OV322]SFC03779.1 Putative cell-wall binding lipoprotein [Bacillus sp. OV322]
MQAVHDQEFFWRAVLKTFKQKQAAILCLFRKKRILRKMGVLLVLKYLNVLFIIGLTAGLSGCFGSSSPEEQIQETLQNTVNQEKAFEKQQKPITDLEKQENAYYQQIIKLGMPQYDQIVSLSDKAIENIKKREQLVEKERKSIISSQDEFKKMDSEISDIDKKDVKKTAVTMQKTMDQRYKAHEKLYNLYKKSLADNKELYQLFKKKDLKMDELQTQIDKINQSYDKVMAENKHFNSLTDQYNKEKKAFYKKAELKNESK